MKYLAILLSLCYCTTTFAQLKDSLNQKILNYLSEYVGVTASDFGEIEVTDHHVSSTSLANHYYLRQNINRLPIFNAIANVTLFDEEIKSIGYEFVSLRTNKISAATPTVSIEKILNYLIQHLGINEDVRFYEKIKTNNKYSFRSTISEEENVICELGYYAEKKQIKLCWDISIYHPSKSNWWSAKIDANNGALLDLNNWFNKCQFHSNTHSSLPYKHDCSNTNFLLNSNTAQYNVFELPIESPNHGQRNAVSNPADSTASPHGWHDTDGVSGAEHTITRGNNVYAYEDIADNNSPGYSPDGGTALSFNFPYNINEQPTNNLDAAITNLFYTNNKIHDIFYHYGFDEQSGNFQEKNYSNIGLGGDYVRAEALDGSGTNNANFATPPEGNRPRMQMYSWSFGADYGNYLQINSPSNIAGSYPCARARFGPELPANQLTGDLFFVEDNVAPAADGCDSIINANLINGKIAVINFGTCPVTEKVKKAQNAGATAVIIINTLGFLFPLVGDDSTINIPSITIAASSANLLINELNLGNSVNGSIDNQGQVNKDSDFDNGIITHEYGHGISKRLTGGASNTNCLRNDEQMGEGWCDWFGLMLTIEPGDSSHDIRGIGTYVKNQSNIGPGIRPAPYSTDFAINNYTYSKSNDVNNVSMPHGVGFIFATMLWDLNWALIDMYGGTPDFDIINGTGGNNIAMKLVVEALKIQPCSPGMVDGRDAILTADQLLYGGIHNCLIWEVFAKRGLGFSADQGSPNSRTDQIEAFDIPSFCLQATAIPTASFVSNNSNCNSTIQFTDSSDQAHSWLWDFGDGNFSSWQNPEHTYQSSGVFNVKLKVVNNLGEDSTNQTINLTLPTAPSSTDKYACSGAVSFVTANSTDENYWYDISNKLIDVGDTLYTGPVNQSIKYFVRNASGAPSILTGPADTSIGVVEVSNVTGFNGINFTVNQTSEILSTIVYAENNGLRSIKIYKGIYDGTTYSDSLIYEKAFYLLTGKNKLFLQSILPDAGSYYIGGNNMQLFRNTTGATYPYNTSLISLDASTDSINPNSYNFFYDMVVQTPRCISAPAEVNLYPVSADFNFTQSGLAYSFNPVITNANNYWWDFGDGNFSTIFNPVHTYQSDGNFLVTLNVNDSSCTESKQIEVLSSSLNIKNSNSFNVYPNPSNGNFSIRSSLKIKEVIWGEIYDVKGTFIKAIKINENQALKQFKLDQSSGVYFLRLFNSKLSSVHKLILQS